MITFPVKTIKEDAAVSPLFGKAKYFAFYDGENLSVESNPYEKGSQLISWFKQKGVDTIVIKEMGSKPFNKILSSNMKVLFAGKGRVTSSEVVKNFEDGILKELSNDELLDIVKKHEDNKKDKNDSSCKTYNHEHNHKHQSSCHKKIRSQHKYVFI